MGEFGQIFVPHRKLQNLCRFRYDCPKERLNEMQLLKEPAFSVNVKFNLSRRTICPNWAEVTWAGLKLAITAFFSLYFQTFWPKWHNFWLNHFETISVYDRKIIEKNPFIYPRLRTPDVAEVITAELEGMQKIGTQPGLTTKHRYRRTVVIAQVVIGEFCCSKLCNASLVYCLNSKTFAEVLVLLTAK